MGLTCGDCMGPDIHTEAFRQSGPAQSELSEIQGQRGQPRPGQAPSGPAGPAGGLSWGGNEGVV